MEGSPPQPGRWQVEQVLAVAPRPNSVAAAQPLAVPAKWVMLGCDDRGVWGRCSGSGAEPYDCVVDHVAVAVRCSCPSRVTPCKHALALLLLWARGLVPTGDRARFAAGWLAGRAAADAETEPGPSSSSPAPSSPSAPSPSAPSTSAPSATASPSASASTVPAGAGDAAPTPLPEPPLPGSSRDDRVARMMAGLAELDRWLDDRLRTGLADPALAAYRTWDQLAARLVDAQVGSLANRVRRAAGVVGARQDWHEVLLAELGLLHLLATAGRHLGDLPSPLADSVAAAVGWLVRQADVMAGVPTTDEWVVMGRSDVREDRIEVRRTWLRGRTTGEWAMVLSFAAYQQRLDDSLQVGTAVHADVFRYPGAAALRVLMGPRHAEPRPALDVHGHSVHQVCNEIGSVLSLEPWLDRIPVCVQAAPARSGGRWVLTDADGALPLADGVPGIAALLACSAGRPVPVTVEWTPSGLVPLTVHLADRAVDIGPVADRSFVRAS